jgi:DNA-directed RNA polymerase II subunit RPB1
LLDFYQLLENKEARDKSYKPFSKYVLRLELDREKMFNKNITMNDVAFVLNNNKSSEIEMVYSDYNSQKLVMRIRLMSLPTAGQMDYLDVIKRFQNNLLNTTVIRGVAGIKAVTFRQDSTYVADVDGEYKNVQQYILDTDGSNFMEVLNHPAVDGNRLYSTNVHDVYGQLGVEAARAILLNEITNLFEEVGINFRHLGLLCDVMTRAGRLMSVDRYGINKLDIGPLAKMSFEQTEDIVLRAALFGERDPCLGVSSKVMLGAPIKAGTSFSEILLDEAAAFDLTKSTPDQTEGMKGGKEIGELSDQQIQNFLYGEESPGPCSLNELRMNVSLRAPAPDAVPEVMEGVEVVLLD